MENKHKQYVDFSNPNADKITSGTTRNPMETKNQTAVEWLVNELRKHIQEYGRLNAITIYQFKMNAKAMEKEQIIKAHGNKKRMTPTVGNYLETYTGEQYYKETYK